MTSFVVLAAAMLAPSESGISVRLTAELVGTATSRPASVEIVATASDGSSERRVPIVVRGRQKVRTALELKPGVWAITVRTPGFWSPETTVRLVAELPAEVRVPIWPTATLTANLVWPKKAATPRRIVAHFRGSPAAPEEQRVPVGFAQCQLKERRVSCEVPASRLDARLVAPGLIPEYFWDVSLLPREAASLGRFRIEAGGSVIGYVRNAQGEPARAVRVELRSSGGQRIPAAAAVPKALAPTEVEEESTRYPLLTTTNQRGFFQVRKAAAGDYRLVSVDEEDAAAETGVAVEQNSESALPDVLVLEHPHPLDVTIEPPLDPRGLPWTLTLTRLLPFEAITTHPVPESGTLLVERIGRGRYILDVSSKGEKWFERSLEVDAAPGPVLIRIGAISVRGRLHLAGEPLKATLHFGGSRPSPVALESDESGDFGGYLPKSGNWPVWVFSSSTQPPVDRMLRSVEVKPDETGVAAVDIDLEDVRLAGRVIDERGRGAKAFVNLNPKRHEQNAARQQLLTDAEGGFDVRGLSPGTYTVDAKAEQGGNSEPVTLELPEGGAEITLLVREVIEIKGRVFSAATGRPISGAHALAWPTDQPMTPVPRTVTDVEGRFSLRLPSGSRGLEALYWADGHSINMSREPLSPGRELVLSVEPASGTLVVEVPDPLQSLDGQTRAALVHRGAAFWVREVLGVLRRRGTAHHAGDVPSAIILPGMAPGEYALCEVSRSLYDAKVPVPFDPSRCVAGSLLPGGELRLRLDSERAGSPGSN